MKKNNLIQQNCGAGFQPASAAAKFGAGSKPVPQTAGWKPAPQLRRGFTLIELLLVLVILGVLAAIVVPKFTGRAEDAKKSAAKTQISNLGVALDAYEIDNGHYPTSDEGLKALFEAPGSAKDWKGPYMKDNVTNDAWGHPYVYKVPGSHNPKGYDLYSVGPDGVEGGDDDIGNWKDDNGK